LPVRNLDEEVVNRCAYCDPPRLSRNRRLREAAIARRRRPVRQDKSLNKGFGRRVRVQAIEVAGRKVAKYTLQKLSAR
jgi:hypothetical protein